MMLQSDLPERSTSINDVKRLIGYICLVDSLVSRSSRVLCLIEGILYRLVTS